MNRDEAFQVIRDLVDKYIDVDAQYLTSTERSEVYDYLDEAQFSKSEE